MLSRSFLPEGSKQVTCSICWHHLESSQDSPGFFLFLKALLAFPPVDGGGQTRPWRLLLALTRRAIRRLIEHLAQKRVCICHQDKTPYFYPLVWFILEVSDTAEPICVTCLSLECTEICFKHVLFIRNVCFKRKKNSCRHGSLINRLRYLFEFSLDKANMMFLLVGLMLLSRLLYCSKGSIAPLITQVAPLGGQRVICMTDLGGFGGQSSHGENSPPSVLIYLFLWSASPVEFS